MKEHFLLFSAVFLSTSVFAGGGGSTPKDCVNVSLKLNAERDGVDARISNDGKPGSRVCALIHVKAWIKQKYIVLNEAEKDLLGGQSLDLSAKCLKISGKPNCRDALLYYSVKYVE